MIVQMVTELSQNMKAILDMVKVEMMDISARVVWNQTPVWMTQFNKVKVP